MPVAQTPPMEGLIVLDLTRALAGPFGTMIFGDLGATIIKIEPVNDGDSTRLLPPFLGDNMTSYFSAINRNKQALSLDLKSAAGQDLFARLAAKADVVFDNFRPNTLERLGIDYEKLRDTVNPKLVSCSISGFGSTGEYALRSSYDLVVQAMSGAMSVTGEPGGKPVRLGLPIGDLAAGMFADIGILAALEARHRTGRGRHIEISMLDCMTALLSYMGAHYLQTGQVPGPQGSGHQVNVPYQAFETKEGWIVIAIFGERYWPELCAVLGRPEMAADPRYKDAPGRFKHKQEILDIIVPILMTRAADEWIADMVAERIPCAPINKIDKVLNDPVLLARHMVVETNHPAYGRARAPGNPIKAEGIRDGVATPAPLPGEHSRKVLADLLGLDDAALDALEKAGAI